MTAFLAVETPRPSPSFSEMREGEGRGVALQHLLECLSHDQCVSARLAR
jgi:hypothetical protein